MTANEARDRAKAITEKPHFTLEDRAYMQGFSDGLDVAQEEESDALGR